jgi:hypothetical protein
MVKFPYIYIQVKTMTENWLISDAAESRRVVQAGAEDSGHLIPESVL